MDGEQSLYLRPFMFASEVFLGVRAAQRVMFSVIASPVGPYFTGGVKPVDIWVTDTYARAGVGGTGAAKCGGNYAASLIAQYEGYEHGCSQVLFIEAADKDRVEELGGMNVFLVTADGRLITPALTGTILEGITRDSILTRGRRTGPDGEERRLTPDEFFGLIADGTASRGLLVRHGRRAHPDRRVQDGHGRVPAAESERVSRPWRSATPSSTSSTGGRGHPRLAAPGLLTERTC